VAPGDIYVAQWRAAFRLLAERWTASFGHAVEPSTTCPRAEPKAPANDTSPGVEYLEHVMEDLGGRTRPPEP